LAYFQCPFNTFFYQFSILHPFLVPFGSMITTFLVKVRIISFYTTFTSSYALRCETAIFQLTWLQISGCKSHNRCCNSISDSATSYRCRHSIQSISTPYKHYDFEYSEQSLQLRWQSSLLPLAEIMMPQITCDPMKLLQF